MVRGCQKPVLLLVLLFLYAVFECPAGERVLRGLDLKDLKPQITASCCPLSDAGQPCIEDQCPVADTQPGNIADGDALTEWVVNFLSQRSNGASPQAAFSFNFGQSYMLHSVTLLSTTRLLPQMWNLTMSSGATMQTLEYSNDGVYEQRAILEGDKTPLEASSLHLSVTLPTMDSSDPISIAEVVIAIDGSSLPEDIGCGMCVELLSNTLDEIIISLRNSSTSLDSLVNQTQIRLLEQGITETKLDVSEYEDSLLVLAVVLGSNPALDENVTLSGGVSRVDLELVPPLPDKLELLKDLVGLTTMFEFGLEELGRLLDEVDPKLGGLIAVHRDIANDVAVYRRSFTELIAALNDEVNITMEILGEVLQILEFVSSINFTREEESLRQYESMVDPITNSSSKLYDRVVLTNQQAVDISASVDSVAALIQETLKIIDEVNRQSKSALRTVDTVDDTLTEIDALRSEAVTLNSSLNSAIEDITYNVNRSLELIQIINSSLQITLDLYPDLRLRISQLRDEVDEFTLLLSPYSLPPSCDLSLPCSENEVHADMLYMNASEIVNSSLTVYTLRRARAFLESVNERGELFDYSLINQTATRAARSSQQALDLVQTQKVSNLLDRVTFKRLSFISLNEQSMDLEDTTNRNISRANILSKLHSELDMQLEELQQNTDLLQNRTMYLKSRTGLDKEAGELLVQAEEARNTTLETDARVMVLEVGLESVASDIIQTRNNTQEAAQALDAAESKFGSIALFLNATRDKVDQFMLNTSAFISENERLIGEINGIISRLANIHSRLNRINSPVQLVSMGMQMPYLSLQPPPGRVISDGIQFESMDLYLWTGARFVTPSVLFYAGPVYHKERDPISDVSASDEDYFLLTVEVGDVLQLQWSVGGMVGMVTRDNFQPGFSQIVVIRHGVTFQLRYGITTGDLSSGETGGSLSNNGSVLFRVSQRTAFLIGGWPVGSQLGVPSSIVPLSTYNTFQGQVQLLLFNGQQWGLWNVRGSSDTNLIGSFQSNLLATSNVWPGSSTTSTPSSISFDGSGYLFVDILSDVQEIVSNVVTYEITTLPADDRDGLVLYAYDEELKVSMEVAYANGSIRLIIYDHAINLTVVDYGYPVATNNTARSITVAFVQGFGFQVAGITIQNENISFFKNLTNVKVWFGGVRMDLLQSPYIPQVTMASYFGCIDMGVIDGRAAFTLLRGQQFSSSFLESPIQKGFSGTCLQSVCLIARKIIVEGYITEVGFGGGPESFLSYTYLTLRLLNNHPQGPTQVVGSSVDGDTVISFSFLAQQVEGVLLAAIAKASNVTVVLSNGKIQVHVRNKNGTSVLTSTNEVKVRTWQQFYLELKNNTFKLYLNGLLQDSQPSLSEFAFEVITTSGSTNPIMFIGGSSSSVATLDISSNVSSFTGCMKDLTFNFNAMDFLNPALSNGRRYPAGVSYHTCPFFNVVPNPLLAVRPDIPQENVCLASAPSGLQGTHGGFHKGTSLVTSNVIGLLDSSWTLSLSLRQMQDGHVMSIGSTAGHVIRLLVRNGQAVMALDGEGSSQEATGAVLDEGVFIAVDINCQVESVQMKMSCLLSVNGLPSGDGRVEVPYSVGSIFFPSLPLMFGMIGDETGFMEMESFVGCIRGLAIDGRSEGFSDVETGVECFNLTQSGIGFSGLSHISVLLSEVSANASHTVTLNYQPQLDNGLLLMLSDSNGTLPALAVGMFNGELRIADLSRGSNGTHTMLGSVCDTSNPSRYNFSLTYGSKYVEATATSMSGAGSPGSIRLPFSSGNGQLLLTIGNTPCN